MLNELHKIGLNEKETEVYVILLKLGPSIANTISKKTNCARTTVYDYLSDLTERGFVTYVIKSGKRYYEAVNPDRIMQTYNEKKTIEQNELKNAVFKLKQIQTTPEKKISVQVYEGKEGLKTAMNLFIKDRGEMLFYGSSGVSYKLIPIFIEKWNKERIRKKIKLKIIYNSVESTYQRIKNGPKLKQAEYRLSPIKDFSMVGTGIKKDLVLMTFWNVENPFAIAIKNEELAKSYKDNFEILWKNSKETKKN